MSDTSIEVEAEFIRNLLDHPLSEPCMFLPFSRNTSGQTAPRLCVVHRMVEPCVHTIRRALAEYEADAHEFLSAKREDWLASEEADRG